MYSSNSPIIPPVQQAKFSIVSLYFAAFASLVLIFPSNMWFCSEFFKKTTVSSKYAGLGQWRSLFFLNVNETHSSSREPSLPNALDNVFHRDLNQDEGRSHLLAYAFESTPPTRSFSKQHNGPQKTRSFIFCIRRGKWYNRDNEFNFKYLDEIKKSHWTGIHTL